MKTTTNGYIINLLTLGLSKLPYVVSIIFDCYTFLPTHYHLWCDRRALRCYEIIHNSIIFISGTQQFDVGGHIAFGEEEYGDDFHDR